MPQTCTRGQVAAPAGGNHRCCPVLDNAQDRASQLVLGSQTRVAPCSKKACFAHPCGWPCRDRTSGRAELLCPLDRTIWPSWCSRVARFGRLCEAFDWNPRFGKRWGPVHPASVPLRPNQAAWLLFCLLALGRPDWDGCHTRCLGADKLQDQAAVAAQVFPRPLTSLTNLGSFS